MGTILIPILTVLLTALLWAGVFALIKFRGWRRKQETVMQATAGLLVLFSLGVAVIGGGMMYGLITHGVPDTLDTGLPVALLSLLPLLMAFTLLDLWKRRVVWTDSTLELHRFMRQPEIKHWNEVVHLERAEAFQSWRLLFRDGTKFGFHDWMDGSSALADAYHAHCPSESLGED